MTTEGGASAAFSSYDANLGALTIPSSLSPYLRSKGVMGAAFLDPSPRNVLINLLLRRVENSYSAGDM